ncbi:nucleotidyltransferase domain-containing protein [Enterovibrio coralii]|uniref:Cyclic GMP-AMP synthase n=1 Tax=Enterovibrio coralii TaxID=294935 RepID=A0A135I3C4_9GAMM|nr:nucleotidyltransferase [Enterovibrio coralii]KXF79941.1 hypothetical protein ATN88_11855 [Enterovibrio coralii]
MQNFKALRQLSQSDKEFSFEMIAHITSNLDLTETQLGKLKSAYQAIGSYLSNRGGWLKDCYIYAQGSVGIGTSVKPLDAKSDMDIDLVLHLPEQSYPLNQYEANQLLRDLIHELKQSSRYSEKVEPEPKRRCVTMQYGSEEGTSFHMDITPSMPEDQSRPSRQNSVRVADIFTANSPSHPYGYRAWFRSICSKEVRWSRRSAYKSKQELRAGTVEDLPGQTRKTVLQIVVQLLKRHRDIWKSDEGNFYKDFAPISIVLTTLAARAYNDCIASGKEYDNPFDLMLDVIESMPTYIHGKPLSDGTIQYEIVNPSLPTENFADKWREKPILAQSFKAWYEDAKNDIVEILEFNQGLDQTVATATKIFGAQSTKGLAGILADTLTTRRALNQAIIASTGLGLGIPGVALAKPVPKHNFFGELSD